MLENFERNLSSFKELRDELCANPARRHIMMDPEWSRPEASEEVKATLYPIFRKIGAKGVYYDGECSFRVAYWSVGFGGDGDYKYYTYNPPLERNNDAKIFLETLDRVDRASIDHEFYLRPIADDWYLAFDHWP